MTLKYPDITVSSLLSTTQENTAKVGGQTLTFPSSPIQHWRLESAIMGINALRGAHTGISEFSCLGYDNQNPKDVVAVLPESGRRETLGSVFASRLHRAIKLLDKELGGSGDEYELRILHIATLNAHALWAHHPFDDVLVPLVNPVHATLAMGTPALTNDLIHADLKSKDPTGPFISIHPDYMTEMRNIEKSQKTRQNRHVFGLCALSLAAPFVWADANIIQPLKGYFAHPKNTLKPKF